MRKHLLCIPMAGLGLVAGSAFALDTSFGVSADINHTDNSLKTHTNERSELEQILRADVAATHTGSKVTADVNYSASRTRYDKNTQDDETEVTGNALISYEQIAQTLIWTLSNTRSSLVRDRSLANTQTNRDERSITRAQGAYVLRPTKADSVTITAFYTDARYDDADSQDSERAGASAVWSRQISKVDSLSLSLDYTDVSFDTQNNDYEYYAASVGYNANLSKLNYQILIGYNEQKASGRTVEGGLLDVNARYNTASSTWTLRLLNELTDTSIGDNNSNISGLNIFTNTNNNGDVLERRSIDLSYSNKSLCQACTVKIAFLYQEEDYEVLLDDSEEGALHTSFDYQFNALTTISAHLGYKDIKFTGGNTRNDYDEVTYGASLSRALSKSLVLSLFLGYEERESDSTTEEFDELRGGASISYRF